MWWLRGRATESGVAGYSVSWNDTAAILSVVGGAGAWRLVEGWVERLRSGGESVSREGRLVAERTLPELQSRLRCLEEIGVGYLTLDRPGADAVGWGVSASRGWHPVCRRGCMERIMCWMNRRPVCIPGTLSGC